MTYDVPDAELRELRLEYLADVREKVELMRRHAQQLAKQQHFKTSFPLLLFLSHQLKGSGGSLGFPRISELALRMNQELSSYLVDEDDDPRMSAEELSGSILDLTAELERNVADADRALRP